MRARHVSMGKSVVDVPTVLQAVKNEFDCLNDDADRNRNEKDSIERNKFHMIAY